jgi:hypothetical protein
VMKNLKKRARSHEDRFPKILFTLSQCRIIEDNGSKDLLFQSQMHIDERDEVVLVAQQWKRQKTRCVSGSWFFIVTSFVTAKRIYREDSSRVTTSHNRLGLSLSKCIRHGLVAKINDKIKPQICEALGRISANHSLTCCVPVPIASPRHVTFGPTRRGKRAWACVSSFLLSFTLLQVYREQPIFPVGLALPPLPMWD